MLNPVMILGDHNMTSCRLRTFDRAAKYGSTRTSTEPKLAKGGTPPEFIRRCLSFGAGNARQAVRSTVLQRYEAYMILHISHLTGGNLAIGRSGARDELFARRPDSDRDIRFFFDYFHFDNR
jgi:hypothetical protein